MAESLTLDSKRLQAPHEPTSREFGIKDSAMGCFLIKNHTRHQIFNVTENSPAPKGAWPSNVKS